MSQHVFDTVNASGNAKVHNGASFTNNSTVTNNNVTNNTTFTIQRAGSIGVKRDATIISWFSSLSFEQAHAQIRDDAGLEDRGDDESEDTNYTGRWLWESWRLDRWRERSIRELWYTGMPGAGKSTLAAIIVEKMINLQNRLSRIGRLGRVAYIYIRHNESYGIDDLLGNIVQQVVKGDGILPKSVTDFYKQFNDKKASRKTTKGLANLVHSLSMEEPIFIIIDAIDESDAEVGKDLIDLLRPKDRNKSGVSLLVTSRIWRNFDHLSKGFCCESIAANTDDLQLFVDHMFRTHGSLRQVHEEHPTIKNAMGDIIDFNGKKIFLLAKLQVQTLLPTIKSRSLSYKDLCNKLQRLLLTAYDLDQMYDRISERILKQRDDDRDAQRAYKLLAWIVLSPRQLTMSELRAAMNQDPVIRDLGDPERQSTQSTIRDICDGIVTFYKGRIRLVHYTTHVYFENNAVRLFGDFQAQIAYTCAAYLCTQGLEKVVGNDGTDYAEMVSLKCDYEELGFDDAYIKHREEQRCYARTLLSGFPLLPYALEYLGHHLRENSGQHTRTTEDNVVSVLSEGPKMAFLYRWLQLMNLIQPLDQQRLIRLSEFNPVGIFPGYPVRKSTEHRRRTCADNLESTRHPPDSDIHLYNQLSCEEVSSMSHVSTEGNDTLSTRELDSFLDEIIRLLDLQRQQRDYDYDDLEVLHGSDNFSETGENANTSSASVPAVEDYGNLPGNQFQNTTSDTNPSHIATLAETPSDLLLAGPDRPTTATHLAAWYGYVPVLEHFLMKQKDINSTDEFNRRPIAIALQQGHMDAVRKCLDYGADIDLSSAEGQRILLQVSRRTDENHGLIRSMIRQNHNRLDIFQQPASFESLIVKVPMFVSCLAVVTAMRLSAPLSKVYRLMHYGDTIMGFYRRLNSDNVLAAAARGDASTIASQIKKNLWNVRNDSGRLGMMSMFVAVEFGSVDTVSALIDGGVDVNIQDFDGNTPLIRAMSRGNTSIVKVLLDRNADVTLQNRKHLTAWSINLTPKNEEALDLLAARGGADPDARYDNGEPVLYCHSAGGNLAFVEWLLGKGTNPSNRTRYGWAPLHWASKNGHIECVDALLRNGAENSPLSDTSLTPLDMAIQQGHQHVITCLQSHGAITGRACYENFFRQYLSWDTSDLSDYASSESSFQDTEQVEIDLIHAQDAFEAALLVLEKRASVPLQTKKRVFEFFFRDISEVTQDLEGLTNDPDHLIASDSASRRWNAIVNGLQKREEIKKLLRD